ncbi:nucleoid-associated protein [Xenorhabdus sp. SGI246]|uniref:nucleoid-associated protein n=1 Tax=Xenorhabdus sp. SGI246 TaxID=3158263 RepID=UPI00349F70BC
MNNTEIDVKYVVVHILHKEQRGTATITLSQSESNVTNASQRLIADICAKHAKSANKGYGSFEGDRDNYPMETFVTDYNDNRVTFYDISCKMMHHLKVRSEEEQMSTGGYVLFSHIVINDNEYILVVMINSTTGSSITADFSIEDSVYLDISKLKVAGRINLTSLKNEAERYIDFLKTKNAISNYFKKFLGCNDIMIAKKETDKLNNALKQFADEQNLSGERRDNFFNIALDYLKNLNKNNEPISIETFANAIWPDEPVILVQKLADDELELSDGFVPDGRIIRNLVSFKGKTNHWEIKFDRAGLIDGSIDFIKEKNEIILKNIPDDLRANLLSEVDSE